ncbi:MaoC/PaaZ C-terminal domain-containing protein [Glaciibacter superstes]|uniref:MaoC/PaaZ C-terminal domain-containing protein n=1 Tax=Glaciibacter superstes TaxID=501023 RepID=UPI0003B76144|nr:MaoC/PaaZ C-terminal domain-containing protein [Glaciibacter superstes]
MTAIDGAYALPPADGLHFEDLTIGDVFKSQGRTATEADLTMFSMLSGDWNPIHADAEYARTTRYGERLVHGVFGLAMITGMMGQAGWFRESAIAMTDIENWKFTKPILVGDTLHCLMEIISARRTSRGDAAVVGRRFTLVNQHDEPVQVGDIGMLLKVRSVRQGY